MACFKGRKTYLIRQSKTSLAATGLKRGTLHYELAGARVSMVSDHAGDLRVSVTYKQSIDHPFIIKPGNEWGIFFSYRQTLLNIMTMDK